MRLSPDDDQARQRLNVALEHFKHTVVEEATRGRCGWALWRRLLWLFLMGLIMAYGVAAVLQWCGLVEVW